MAVGTIALAFINVGAGDAIALKAVRTCAGKAAGRIATHSVIGAVVGPVHTFVDVVTAYPVATKSLGALTEKSTRRVEAGTALTAWRGAI